jgi:Arc/MetJ-type ribon-helix-helix transcriptional regulator
MNVHLTPELAQLVQTKVKSGRYNSASEWSVRPSGSAERDQLTVLRKSIRQQIDGLERPAPRGGVDGEQFFADLERKEHALTEPQPKPA